MDGLRFPKGETRKAEKARNDRAEAMQKRAVRRMVAGRDGYCRLARVVRRDLGDEREVAALCGGTSEWAHLEDRRRSRTVGEAPEARHTTAGTAMLCRDHHQLYDRHRIQITMLSRYGADGPMRFREGR